MGVTCDMCQTEVVRIHLRTGFGVLDLCVRCATQWSTPPTLLDVIRNMKGSGYAVRR